MTTEHGFDPRSSAERQQSAPLTGMGRVWIEQLETYFKGVWGERNPLNTPRPFYGAETDNASMDPSTHPSRFCATPRRTGLSSASPELISKRSRS